jgi:hypothetical protein
MSTRRAPRSKTSGRQTNGKAPRPTVGPRPLGWLPTPPDLEKEVRAMMPAHASEEAIRYQLNNDVLSYYYGGELVLVRTDFYDPRGVEVIAAGDDVAAAVRSMTPEQRAIYGTACPIPLDTYIL